MNLKRTATIAVVGGALIAWLAGAATSNHPIAPAPVVAAHPIEVQGAELANEIARLHDRLKPEAKPVGPGRNLFAFRAAPVRPAPPPVATPVAALSEAAPLVPAPPPLTLEGIAEDAGADGPARTAFIAGGGLFFMVKEGDSITARYRVVKISADVVELSDESDHTIRRLALR
ncbi:MAG TPA: hypothetical protein VGG73_16230 [Vicinamibacterales bacterium]|jgi:hypothetical protein